MTLRVENTPELAIYEGILRTFAAIDPAAGYNLRFNVSRKFVDLSEAQGNTLPLVCLYPGEESEDRDTSTGEQRYGWSPVVICYCKTDAEDDWLRVALAAKNDLRRSLWFLEQQDSEDSRGGLFYHVPRVAYVPPEDPGGIGIVYMELRIVYDALRGS